MGGFRLTSFLRPLTQTNKMKNKENMVCEDCGHEKYFHKWRMGLELGCCEPIKHRKYSICPCKKFKPESPQTKQTGSDVTEIGLQQELGVNTKDADPEVFAPKGDKTADTQSQESKVTQDRKQKANSVLGTLDIDKLAKNFNPTEHALKHGLPVGFPDKQSQGYCEVCTTTIRNGKCDTINHPYPKSQGCGKITFNTNTAWLLNMWFTDKKSFLYKKEREWIEQIHENHWKGRNDSVVKVTFEIMPHPSCQAKQECELSDEEKERITKAIQKVKDGKVRTFDETMKSFRAKNEVVR